MVESDVQRDTTSHRKMMESTTNLFEERVVLCKYFKLDRLVKAFPKPMVSVMGGLNQFRAMPQIVLKGLGRREMFD
jgi:hypothetical protein